MRILAGYTAPRPRGISTRSTSCSGSTQSTQSTHGAAEGGGSRSPQEYPEPKKCTKPHENTDSGTETLQSLKNRAGVGQLEAFHLMLHH